MTAAARRYGAALALTAAALVAFFFWRSGEDRPRTDSTAPSPSPTRRADSTRAPTSAVAAEPTPAGPTLAGAAPAVSPTRPPSFDFAKMTPPARTPSSPDERFETSDKFTADDLAHPERYFERAERVPELNRAEERRDALAFFVTYREKLGRDLEAARDDPDRRSEIAATIVRYDTAIERMRGLIAGKKTE